MGEDSKYYKEIIDKLERLVRKEYTLFASIGIQGTVLIAALTFTTFVTIESLAGFSSAVRTAMFAILIAITATALLFLFIIPLLKRFNVFRNTDYHRTAQKVGKGFPSIKDDLLNAMQLVSDKKDARYSRELIDAAFQNVYNRSKDIKFESLVSFKKAKELFIYSASALTFCALLLIFVPGLGSASYRLVNFDREFIQPAKYSFVVNPGNTKVTRGDNIAITVKVNGGKPKEVDLAVKSSAQTGFESRKLLLDSLGLYRFEVPAVRRSFKYYAEAGNLKSETFNVEVIDRPVVKTLKLVIYSPAYSKIPGVKQEDNGNISALTGSRAELNISSTKPLKSAYILFGDSVKKDMKINADKAYAEFKVTKDNAYKILITDLDGNINSAPITYSIKALSDAFPNIEIAAPNKNTLLPNDNRQPLDIKISDDYGFSKLLLKYRLSGSRYEHVQKEYKSIEIPFSKNMTEEEVNYVWNLTDMGLSADDAVSYYAEVFDNDNVSGPKSAKSPEFVIRVPSLNELLNKAENTQAKGVNDLEDTFKKAEELKQTLQDIAQSMKQDKKELTWQEKQKVEQAMDQFKDIQKKVKDIGSKINEMQQDLQKNNLLSKETLEKYMELQKLFDEMSNDEMKKMMDQLKDVLQKMDRKQTQDALANMQINEDQFKQSIERTMNLLKRIQVAQKVDDLLKRSEQIVKQQTELKNETQKSDLNNQQENKQLGQKQSDISKQLDEYKKQLDELEKKMEEIKDLPKEEAGKLRKQFEQQGNRQLSQQAQKNINQSMKQNAEQNQEQIAQNMNQMKSGMQQLQQSMAQQNQVKTFRDMMKITDNLLTLSKQQENLRDQSKNIDAASSSFTQNAEKQLEIRKNLDKVMQRMSQLSQKTFAVTPEMGKALGDAKKQMGDAMHGMQNRSGGQTAGSQGKAMESLNEAAMLMKSSMESMMKGGGQGGMMSLMQQLQQMANQQMNLNNLSQMLQKAMSGKLTMQQQAELQRLAQQQELIQKSLKQLNKEAQQAGQSKKIPADLEHIARQMEEVVTNMKSDDLNEGTVQLQEHILSKLLDAQRSVNERDYEKRRESASGKEIAGKPPAELNLSGDKGKNKLRDELNRAVQEGYSKDYEELIRKYYEALQKENAKSN